MIYHRDAFGILQATHDGYTLFFMDKQWKMNATVNDPAFVYTMNKAN